MQKTKLTYRLSAGFMAMLMLFSSMAFSMDIHYCMGQVADISLFGQAEECNMSASNSAINRDADDARLYDSATLDNKAPCKEVPSCCEKPADLPVAAISKPHCCSDECLMLEVEGDTELALDHQQSINFVVAFFTTYNGLVSSTATTTYSHYVPPSLSRDLPVLVQSFLL